MEEIWRNVLTHNGYKVSNLGKVMSFRKVKSGKLMIPSSDKDGYLKVNLSSGVGTKAKSMKIHVLVLQAFIGVAPVNKPNGCHKNDIKTDNRLENLYWGTQKENVQDALINKTWPIGEDSCNAKLTNKEVYEIKDLVKNGYKDTEIGNFYGVHAATIWCIRNRENSWKI